ncbi:MAG: type VI secretion system tube protein Hcp, partial [Phycisphaerae bacterium]
ASTPAATTGHDPIYMKYGNITGNVTAKGFLGDSQLTSFQWGVGRSISSGVNSDGNREASAPSVSEIVVTKQFDSASLPLIQEAFGGTPSRVETDFVNATAKGTLQTYLKLELDNTLLSGYSISSGGDRPSESLSLNFTKISFTAGKDTFSYDLTKTQSAAAPAALAPPSAGVTTNTAANNPIFMKYGSITGDVTAKGYLGDTQLTSFQWGVGRSISRGVNSDGNREASAPSVSEIVVTKRFDSASVPLIKEAFGGTPSSVETDFVNATAKGTLQTYLKLELDNTLISGYSMSSGGDRPSESLSLNFTKISFSAGKDTFSYDLTKVQPTATPAAALPNASTPAATTGHDPIYMKYGSITGDVTAKGYQGDTQLTSFQWGVGRSISSGVNSDGNREASVPSVSEIVVSKQFDSASLPLIKEAFGGTPSSVETDFVNTTFKGTLQTYLKLELDNTLISGYSLSSGGDRPSESLSLNFTKISFTAGKNTFSYDLAKVQPAAAPAALAAATPGATTGAATAFGNSIYMKYDGITGDVTTKGYLGDTRLTSFQWGVSRAISNAAGADRVASAPQVTGVTIGKVFDAASLPLLQNAFNGQSANVETDFVTRGVKGTLQTYLKLELDNTLISGYSLSSGGDRPTESLSLNFSKISFTVGKQTFSYDLTKVNTV